LPGWFLTRQIVAAGVMWMDAPRWRLTRLPPVKGSFFSYRSPFSCLLGSRHRLCFASAEATVGDRADLLPLRYFSLVFRFFFVLFGVGGGGET